MKRQWKFLKCEKCVNHGKCKEQKRLRKMRWLIPGCMVDVERKMTTSIKKERQMNIDSDYRDFNLGSR